MEGSGPGLVGPDWKRGACVAGKQAEEETDAHGWRLRRVQVRGPSGQRSDRRKSEAGSRILSKKRKEQADWIRKPTGYWSWAESAYRKWASEHFLQNRGVAGLGLRCSLRAGTCLQDGWRPGSTLAALCMVMCRRDCLWTVRIGRGRRVAVADTETRALNGINGRPVGETFAAFESKDSR